MKNTFQFDREEGYAGLHFETATEIEAGLTQVREYSGAIYFRPRLQAGVALDLDSGFVALSLRIAGFGFGLTYMRYLLQKDEESIE